ncbi:hypothetical protein ACH5RR_023056 [Cinchona calisaya]|uniref:Uncharacterized protein n=1 Tax=Cinchona calisaya TaxID=153742 RepID=A0ABD2ZAN3_9GENT
MLVPDVEDSHDQKRNLMDTISCPSTRMKNLTSNRLVRNLVMGLPTQNTCKRGKGVHGKKKFVYDIVKSHSLDLDTKDIVDDGGELNCVQGYDIDDLEEVSKLAQERGNSIQNFGSAIVDNLNSHRIANDVEIDCNTIDMANTCKELSSNEVEEILEHVFGELREIPSKVVSSLRKSLNLDFLQDDLDTRPKVIKFRQSMFAGRFLGKKSVPILTFLSEGISAQIGFHTWSPDAMEGPTPISA